jgi:uncharacterized protein YdcH (DUF465 family)
MRLISIPVILFVLVLAMGIYLIYRERKFGQVVSENGNLMKLLSIKNQEVIKGDSGETLIRQAKIEVSRQTLNQIMGEKINQLETRLNTRFNRIENITQISVKTITKQKMQGKDTVMVWHFDSTAAPKMDTVLVFRFTDKFGTSQITVKGKEAIKIDSTVNSFYIIEDKEKWKLKHLFIKREKRFNLIIMNPNSRLDTLRNLSVMPK